MTFEEMLTYWSLKGSLTQVDTGVRAKSWKKTKVCLDDKHIMFVRYDSTGPMNASLYLTAGSQFKLVDRVGVSNPVQPARALDVINSWIKDLK